MINQKDTDQMKLNKKLGLMLVSTLILVSACKGINISGDKSKRTTTLLVSHYKVECTALKIDLCLQIKTKGSSELWKEYAADIKKFGYEWGNDYEIEVTYVDQDPAPKNAPRREYTLVKTLSKTKVPTTSLFVLNVSRKTSKDLIIKSNTDNSIYRIYNDIDIKCDTNENNKCSIIEDNIKQDNAIKFVLSHNAASNKPLDISSIACASARKSFKTDCK